METNRENSGREDLTSEEEYKNYRSQARGKYNILMAEFEFRCHRAALINYFEASKHDKNVYRMELLSVGSGAMSGTLFATWLYHERFFNNMNKMGSFGMAVVVGGWGTLIMAELFGKISTVCTSVIPSFSKRAEAHNTAAAAWQKLEHKTRSYRIQLENPKFDVDQYKKMYDDLTVERKDICRIVNIPRATYDKYNNSDDVFEELKQRRIMLQKFLQMEKRDSAEISGKNA